MSYAEQERAERKPRRIVDHTATWAKLEPVGSVNGQADERLERFCESKRITLAGLDGARRARTARRGGRRRARVRGRERRRRRHGDQVPAARRLLARRRRPRTPSTWLRPIVVGKRDSLDWLVAEGETDARSPRRARRRRRRDARAPGRGSHVQARVGGAHPARRHASALCHDADEDGDAGAEKAAKIIGGTTVRVRPPVEGGDWCDWDGGRDEFLELVGAHAPRRATSSRRSPTSSRTRSRRPSRCSASPARSSSRAARCSWSTAPTAAAKIDVDDRRHRAPGRRRRLARHPGAAAGAHLHHRERRAAEPLPAEARREDRDLGRPRLRAQPVRLPGAVGRVHVRRRRSARGARRLLRGARDRRRHGEPDARPRRRRLRPARRDAAVRRLARRVRAQERARVLAPAPREQGRPDLAATGAATPTRRCQLQQDGNRPRTKLDWAKTRWATLPTETIAKACMLEWIVETQGYSVTELDTVGASDAELEERDRRLPRRASALVDDDR